MVLGRAARDESLPTTAATHCATIISSPPRSASTWLPPVVNESNRLLGFISLADLALHCRKRREKRELAGVLEAVSTP